MNKHLKKCLAWLCVLALAAAMASPALAAQSAAPEPVAVSAPEQTAAPAADAAPAQDETPAPAEGAAPAPAQEAAPAEDTAPIEDAAPIEDTAPAQAPAPAPEGDALVTVEVDLSDRIIQCGGIGGEAAEPGTAQDKTYDAYYNWDAVASYLRSALEQRQPAIYMGSFGIHTNDIGEVYFDILNASPWLFHVDRYLRWDYNSRTGAVETLYPTYNSQYTQAHVAQFNEAVDKALQCVESWMNDWQKALALHDYLAVNVAYDETLSRFNAYQALVEHDAVCQGYALAYCMLLQKCGIAVDYAQSDAMNHIWNLVRIYGNWYHVDVTWDDPLPDTAGQALHTHFLRSDNGIWQNNHYAWEADYDCYDTSFEEDVYWSLTTSPVLFGGGNTWLLDNQESFALYRIDAGGTWTRLLDNSGGYAWFDSTSCLSALGDTFFWNNWDAVFRWTPGAEASPSVVCRVPAGYRVAGCYCADGQLTIMRSANGGGRSMLRIPVTPGPVGETLPAGTLSPSWQGGAGAWYYMDSSGAPMTGVQWLAEEDGRYIFDSRGFLLTGDSEGDVLINGNLYYINPDRKLNDPRTCYAVRNYTRNRGQAIGITYYDGDGITFRGWIKDASGSMRYQTCIPKENVPGATKDLYIYVWRAQTLPACQHPDHPGDPAYTIPAGRYFFDDNGVLVTQAGWYEVPAEGRAYRVDAGGRILEERAI